ncbi:hypothetical protein Bbelb_205430, partial [Branchiostoma belcheri]
MERKIYTGGPCYRPSPVRAGQTNVITQLSPLPDILDSFTFDNLCEWLNSMESPDPDGNMKINIPDPSR